MTVPPSTPPTPLTVPFAVLDEARRFFEDCGSRGCEGTAMIAASVTAIRLVIPDQHATPAPYCSVEVTLQGKLELAGGLRSGETYVSRIHSHPELPFHSPTDDRNPALTHEGALSIVVPFFGLGLRQGFSCCAVYVRQGHEWIELPTGSGRDRFVVVR